MTEDQLPLRIHALDEAQFALDGGAMFGIIPKPLWERTNPADERNRIAMSCRCILIEYPDRRVLVDVGIGSRWTDKERDIYRIADQDDKLRHSLAKHGLSPKDIDDVILTHLHFDHAGGLCYCADDGTLEPTYPNARHWLQRRNWSWAHAPSARDQGSYRLEDFAFLETNPDAPELILLDGIAEIMPGIEVFPVHGHTFGMQVIKIQTVDMTYLYCADLIPTSTHIRLPYVMGYDLQPLVTVEEKRAMLYSARRQDWCLLFQHDPIQVCARLETDPQGRLQAVECSSAVRITDF